MFRFLFALSLNKHLKSLNAIVLIKKNTVLCWTYLLPYDLLLGIYFPLVFAITFSVRTSFL
jgi:hypothetical protein